MPVPNDGNVFGPDALRGLAGQVELNTIASSFGALSTLVSGLHKHVLERAGRPDADLNRLPPNNAAAQLADAIIAAAAEFGDTEAAVLFVVQPNERNSYDQQVSARLPVLAALSRAFFDPTLVLGLMAYLSLLRYVPWWRDYHSSLAGHRMTEQFHCTTLYGCCMR